MSDNNLHIGQFCGILELWLKIMHVRCLALTARSRVIYGCAHKRSLPAPASPYADDVRIYVQPELF